ncbi:MAG: Gfo/Idh/MocA family oxidoreductase [Anaerolineae bacterium]
MKIIRWGIIGCGNVTEVKSGPGFQKANNSRLVAVMRRTGDLARDYARRHGVPRWYADAEALIHDPEVDAVYVATPPSSHKEYTLMAARAGKPVYVEKPMALNFEECQEMIEACRSTQVPLFVAYYRRALQRFLKIKELLEAGLIGQVRFVTMTLCMPPRPEELEPEHLPWRVVPEIAGGGRFVDLGSHMFDFLDYVLGPIHQVSGFATNQQNLYPAEDVVSAAFVFESGVHGVGLWNFGAFDQVDLTEIVGSRGKISFSTYDARPVVLTTGEGTTEFEIGYPPHVQQPLIQTVVDDLNGIGRCPSTGESAARTTWVMDQILRDYRTRQLGWDFEQIVGG